MRYLRYFENALLYKWDRESYKQAISRKVVWTDDSDFDRIKNIVDDANTGTYTVKINRVINCVIDGICSVDSITSRINSNPHILNSIYISKSDGSNTRTYFITQYYDDWFVALQYSTTGRGILGGDYPNISIDGWDGLEQLITKFLGPK